MPRPSVKASAARRPAPARWVGSLALLLSGSCLGVAATFFLLSDERPPVPLSVATPPVEPAATLLPPPPVPADPPTLSDTLPESIDAADAAAGEGEGLALTVDELEPLVEEGVLDENAGTLVLTNGRRLDGVVEEVEGGYRIRTGRTSTFIAADRVARYAPNTTAARELREYRRLLAPDDAEGRVALSDWCRVNGLPKTARALMRQAARLRPEDGALNRRAGFVRHEGRWIPFEEAQRAKGLEYHNGRWRKRSEVEQLLALTREREFRSATVRAAAALLEEAAVPGKAGDDRWEIAERIARMGPEVFPVLEQALARDGTRTLAAMAWSRFQGVDSLNRLIDLLRFSSVESRPALLTALSHRTDRAKALPILLDQAVNIRSGSGRRRVIEALALMADARVIDALIPLVEFSPVPIPKDYFEKRRGPSKTDGSDQFIIRPPGLKNLTRNLVLDDSDHARGEYQRTTDWDEIGRQRAEIPWFPAHEALTRLLNDALPINRAAVEHYWTLRRRDFRFQPPSLEDWGSPPAAPARPDRDLVLAAVAGPADGDESANAPLAVKARTVEEDLAAEPEYMEFDRIEGRMVAVKPVESEPDANDEKTVEPKRVTSEWLLAEARRMKKLPGDDEIEADPYMETDPSSLRSRNAPPPSSPETAMTPRPTEKYFFRETKPTETAAWKIAPDDADIPSTPRAIPPGPVPALREGGAELPDWLGGGSATATPAPTPSPAGVGGLPDWLNP